LSLPLLTIFLTFKCVRFINGLSILIRLHTVLPAQLSTPPMPFSQFKLPSLFKLLNLLTLMTSPFRLIRLHMVSFLITFNIIFKIILKSDLPRSLLQPFYFVKLFKPTMPDNLELAAATLLSTIEALSTNINSLFKNTKLAFRFHLRTFKL
jgi:hypothetical protein